MSGVRTVYNYLKFVEAALVVSGVVGLCVLFWPGALAAVSGFSLFGLSIAGVVGGNFIFQTLAVMALTFASLNVIALAIDATQLLFNWIKGCCTSKEDTPKESPQTLHEKLAPKTSQSPTKMVTAMPPSHDARNGKPTPSHYSEAPPPYPHQVIYQQPTPPSYPLPPGYNAYPQEFPEGYQPIYPTIFP